MAELLPRRIPMGAEVTSAGVEFRIWAPAREVVDVVLEDDQANLPLSAQGDGFFSGCWEGLAAGARYRYRLDGGDSYPDFASRCQPDGVHGASQVIDPTAFGWTDAAWKGRSLAGQVLYELHIGSFTPEGTFRAAEAKLGHLRTVGVTVIELMPVAEFGGEFGWGYDGVYWYAPSRLYGAPDDFRHFVDCAHRQGIAVILDVVYNHFGPSGNYTGAFSPYFVSRRHPTEWGDAINYDGEACQAVRQFAIANAAHWIAEYHLDGLRIDATQAIFDDSPHHLIGELSVAARQAAGERSLILIAENDAQDVRHMEAVKRRGFGLDGLWNDDFHHSCRVAATGHAEFYYADFTGSAQELLSATKWSYLFQGQHASAAGKWRGTPTHAHPAWRFLHYLQNHDQVANSAHGLRLPQLTSPGRYRALTTLLLLGPSTPMLFMGQEFAASAPFLYFADHEAELAELVRAGRWEFLHNFPRIGGQSNQRLSLADPAERTTFEATKLDWSETESHAEDLHLHTDLLTMRREDTVFSSQDRTMLHGAVIADEAFLLRWMRADGNDRLLIVNLGRDYHWSPISEPLMAPPANSDWGLRFSSEHPRYGGSGTAPLDMAHLLLPGHAAIVLAPVARTH